MHTVFVITCGFALLAVFCLVGRARGGPAGVVVAARAFLPVWLIVSVVNLMVGVLAAGYGIVEELPILLVVFGIPAAVAVLVMRRSASR